MKFISIKGLMFGALLLSASVPVLAGADEDYGPVVHPTLELYERDASDECVADTTQIRVTAHNIHAEGILKLELYNSKDGFLYKKGRLRRVRVEAKDSPMVVCINVLKAGVYAVAGYHDLDGNRKLKQKWDFTPKEPYGLSNNPEYKKKLPKFNDAAFNVGEKGTDIEIFFQKVGKSKKKKS